MTKTAASRAFALIGFCLAIQQQHWRRAAAAVAIESSRNFTHGNWSDSSGEDTDNDEQDQQSSMSSYRSTFILIVSLSLMCLLAMGFLAYGLFSRAEAIKDDDDAAAEMDMDQAMFGGFHEGGGGGGVGD